MQKKTCLFLLFLLLFGLGGCSSRGSSGQHLFRFIDILDEDCIVLSPLSGSRQGSSGSKSLFPAETYPLLDKGSGNNPFGIKRKLKLKGREVNALYCPPRSVFRYGVSFRESLSLDFGIAVIRNTGTDVFQEKERMGKRGVTFSVILEAEGKRQTLFQKHLPSPEEGDPFIFELFKVDLPGRQEDLDILFETDGDPSLQSFWVNPLFFQEQADGLDIILISVDTLRADHLGCYGYERETSPHIDALAADGVTFFNTYASSPWTLPSHVSLLTSLHAVRHQVAYENDTMDPSLMTLADILRTSQFYCAALTGGGFVSAKYGFSKGFNSYSDEGGVLRQDSAEHLFQAADRWLEREKDKGFFLFLHTFQPHSPYACPYPYKTMFLEENPRWRHLDLMGFLGGVKGIFQKLTETDRRNIVGLYDGEIRYTDEEMIGPLIEDLKNTGLYDRTMIIFTSDHGEEFFDHHGWGHGHSLYDESLKVPLIIKFPESRFKGRRIHDIVSLVDIFPTVLEEAGIDFSGMDIDGRSLLPLIEGKASGDRKFLANIAADVLASRIPQKIAMNRGREKLILNKPFTPEDLRFFLYPPPERGLVELYDLGTDPEEDRNIADQRPRVASAMIRVIDEIIQAIPEKKTEKLEMDEELREQLRALGYIR